MIRKLVLPALLLAAPLHAQAVTPDPGAEVLIDRVVAVVGDTVLLMSDIQTEIERLRAAGQLPQDPAAQEAVAQSIFESNINDLILLTAAREAGVVIPDEQINEQVDAEIRRVEQRFGTPADFDAALAGSGLTRERYRQTLTNDMRDQATIQEFLRSRLANRARPVVDDREIREFFEGQQATLPDRPATISFAQVVVAPEPSPEARQAAIEEAQQVLDELLAGGDFEVLARRFSDDEGTREYGGDLGWFGAGRMVPEFEQVAFAMRAGQTSGIVESPFGYHIIRVDRTRGAERQARHILITPEVTDEDRTIARERADSVATAIRGGASATALADLYNNAEDPPSLDQFPVDRLPPGYAEPLATAEAGEVIGPFELPDPQNPRWVVLRVSGRQEAGEYTLDDVRDDIRQRIEQQKMVEELLLELRQQVYVSEDM